MRPLPGDLGDPGRHSCSRVGGLGRLEQLDRALEVRGRVVLATTDRCHHSCPFVELRLRERVIGQLAGALEGALRLRVRAEGVRALGRPHEHLERLRPQLVGVGIIRRGVVRVEVVSGDDLDDLVLLRAPCRCEELSGCEVLGLPLASRDRLVGDPLDDVLEERVLPPLGRPGISLHRKDLLTEKAAEQRFELRLHHAADCSETLLRKRLAEHRAALDQAALLGPKRVESRRHQRVQGLRNLQILDSTGRAIHVAIAGQKGAIEQHADRFDRIERHALCPVEYPAAQVVRKAGDEPVEKIAHRRGGERFEVERTEAPLAGTPARSLVAELRSGERQHEQRMAARPVQQILEEVEQTGVRPLKIFEHEDRRRIVRQALEEDSPGREEVLLVSRNALIEPQEVRQTGLDPGPLLAVEEVFLEGEPQLRARRFRFFVLQDAAAHAHHLGERPIRDPLAVRKAAAAMPERVAGQTVDVLLELPGKPGLADARNAGDEGELGALFVRRIVEQLLHEPELSIPADEWRFEAARAEQSLRPCDDPQRAPEGHGLGLPLELMLPGVVVGDRGLRGALGGLADEHCARLRDALDPRSGVDEIPGDQALAGGAKAHGRLAAEDPGAGLEARVESRYGRDQLEGRPDRPLDVILLRDRCAPDGHHRVTDELLNAAAVALDDLS